MNFVSDIIYKELNDYKNKIILYKNWISVVKLVFMYEKISTFDKVRRASRSYYKMYEICRKFNIVEPHIKKICCLCDAPGGFVEAMMELSPGCSIYAQSLNSKDSIKFAAKIPTHIIHYGSNQSGDLTQVETINSIVDYTSQYGKFNIITADGGIDSSDDYENQETKNSKLLFCQIITMLQTISLGGKFIVKVFDCFTQESVKLLYILFESFQYVEIIKPLLSRPCNSEKYIVCIGFKECSQKFNFLSKEISILDFELPKMFIDKMIKMNNEFALEQIKNIKLHIEYCKNGSNNNTTRLRQTQSSRKLFHDLKIPSP